MSILVTRSSLPPFNEYIEELRSVWDTHWLTNMGSKHKELEASLSSFLGADFLSLFTNGHLALEMVLQALELEGNHRYHVQRPQLPQESLKGASRA